MIKRILLATDFSSHTEPACALAIDLATQLGASVDVVHAIEPFPGGEEEHAFDDLYFKLERRAEAEMAKVIARLREANLRVSSKVVIEKRWRAIIERAEAERADLIVMGSGGAIGPNGKPVGSTSHRVFLASPIPLVVVPAR